MVPKQKQRAIWVVWLLFWPIIIALLFNHSEISSFVEYNDLLIFILLAAIVSFFPIKINNSPFFLINAASLAAFITFGLFGEVIITQVAALVVIMRLKINKTEHYRIPLNLLLFLFISILSATVYNIVGNVMSDYFVILGYNILQLFAYALTSILANKIGIYYVRRYLYRVKASFLGESFYLSLFSLFYTLPTAILIIYLYQAFGVVGVLIMSAQIAAISLSIKLYYRSEKSNEYLQSINKIAQRLTGHLSRAEVINTFLTMLPEYYHAHAMALYKITNPEDAELVHMYKHSDSIQTIQKKIKISDYPILNEVYSSNKSIYFNKEKEWSALVPPELKDEGESLVVMPVGRKDQVTGILLMTDHKRYAFEKSILSVLNLLNNYFDIALENAQSYEEVKADSRTDHLTGLPNFRHFETLMKDYENRLDTSINVTVNTSLIILDLDYFKKVNDQYGHECGNEVLIQLANLLNHFFKDKGDVFRYGGEEFIIFLPGYSRDSSVETAEAFRKLLEDHEFVCHNYLENNQSEIRLKLTASLGVASLPEHTENINSLIRLADRAMYLGAKRDGRNKVGVYST